MKIVEYSKSSNIDKTSYDEDKQVMYIKFRSGGSYSYEGIPSEVYHKMQEAPSAGKYFHTVIKNSYPYRKVDNRLFLI